MKWVEANWFKIAILLCILLAIFFTYHFVNEYLDQQNGIANQEAVQQKLEKDRAYAASQKEACLAIYKQESSKWNNVSGWRYDDQGDKCYIQYKNNPPKTVSECISDYMSLGDRLLCYDGLFETAF
jgi:hypothetical protein